MNIERLTSNNVFCHFIKRLNKTVLPFENMLFACFKIDKAQRHQYWMFEVGRSMLDVQSFQCSEQTESHTRVQGSRVRGSALLLG